MTGHTRPHPTPNTHMTHMTDMNDAVTKVIAHILARYQDNRWNEDRAWRFVRELFPCLSEGAMQQIADRVQLAMG